MRTKPSVPPRRCARRTMLAKYLAEDELKLYRLIWMRFVASQMMPAVFDQTTIEVTAKGKDGADYTFRATGSVLKFDGFLKVYEEGKDQKDEEDEELKHKLPAVAEGEELKLQGDQAGAALHRTAAALQRSDAGQEAGSRRRGPAVHLRVDSVHHSGARVREEGRRQVHAHRTRHGGDGPAARKLRRHLRRDATRRGWKRSSTRSKRASSTGAWPWREFYERFEKDLEHAEAHMTDIKRMEKPTDLMCEKCGKPLVIKWGKHGSFIACTGYPDCTYTRELTVDLPDVDKADLTEQGDEEYCENCGRPMVLKKGRFGHVLRLLRLSRTARPPSRSAARRRKRRAARREVPAVRQQPGAEVRALRRVHGLQQLSDLQVRQAEDHRREVPEVLRRRGRGAALQTRQDVLRLQPLSRVRFRGLGQAGCRRSVRSAAVRYLIEKCLKAGPVRAVPQRRVQVQAAS